MNITSIKEIIPQVIEKISAKKPQTPEKMQRVFQKVMEDMGERKAAIGGFKEGDLQIKVDSSARLFLLNSKKRKILEHIQEEIPDVKTISVRIGKIK